MILWAQYSSYKMPVRFSQSLYLLIHIMTTNSLDLNARIAVISTVVDEFERTASGQVLGAPPANEGGPKKQKKNESVFEEASKNIVWPSTPQGVLRNARNDAANVRVTFNAFTKFLSSDEASPYSEKERKSAAFKHLKAAFEPGGALYNDILDANLNIKQKFEATADTLPNFLTQLMGYGKSVEQSVQNGHSDSAKNALSQFPMLDSNQYLCVPGTSIKMHAASRLLAQNPAQIAIVAGYNQSVLPLLTSANQTVFEGN